MVCPTKHLVLVGVGGAAISSSVRETAWAGVVGPFKLLIFRTFLRRLRNHAGVAGIFRRGLLGTWEGRVCVQECEFGALEYAEN